MPLSLKLGPGIIGNMFDGIQRPLKKINEISYGFIDEGIGLISIDKEKQWDIDILVKVGDKLKSGDVYAEVQETNIIKHKIMVPQRVKGEVIKVKENGKYNIEENIVTLKDGENIYKLNLYQRWPVRKPRPIKNRLPLSKPLITGQRILDMFFPIAKGGTVAIPGSFGTGKTMTQHQLAKWSDADIIVYIGCGERGNEMTEVLEDFPKLVDPKTNTSLMNRTVLIANTSNMPVAAREASIYTGITIAEYYRDMGYDVAIMADSTSRITSYSQYMSMLTDWYIENISEDVIDLKNKMLKILFEENKLQEIVKLVGEDVLPDDQRLILEVARILKVGFLQQNAYHNEDTYVPKEKQYKMLKAIELLYDNAYKCVKMGIPISQIRNEEIFGELVKMKYNIPNEDLSGIAEIEGKIYSYYKELIEQYSK
ncbi:V-type ATP synthase subunit A [Clostridium cochlearium]|uniref:ATP synthase beta subunit C-terminal domain-containing protein n=1 Tax=Clostridium cochlearium TaxID=1494 RepID=UPI000B94E981|nr:V-type ATP synthase subunit A [Clostridium cochlearium]SNV87025.1 V-type ATP synthase subunit A [Clostridium cochlearium]STA93440.1 V-type ATP synthase subunit A [Clostridium cochlearium]